jgi:hypothetical protein
VLHLAHRIGGIGDAAAGLHLVEVDAVQRDRARDVLGPRVDAILAAIRLRRRERDLRQRSRLVRLLEVCAAAAKLWA